MKVFLTGGSGYLGQPTIAELVRHGHVVTALARSERAAHVVESAGATAVPGDLTDLDVLRHAAAGAEAVIHLAQSASGEEDLAAATAMQDGVGHGIYVHTGGCWVYGNTDGVADETAPRNPPGIVAWRKPVEDAVLVHAEGGARTIIVQPGLVYGGDNGLIDLFLTQPGKKNGAIPYIGDGVNHWALVHLEDVVNLYLAALSAKAEAVYLGVGGVNPTAKEIAGAVAHGAGLAGKTTSITLEQARADMGPFADAFALDQRFSPAKAQAELGWVPGHTDPLSVLAGQDAAGLDAVAADFRRAGVWLLAAEAGRSAAAAHRAAGRLGSAIAAKVAAESCLDSCGNPRVSTLPAEYCSPLTPREEEVVALAAVGWASRPIAHRLGLSVRTVDNHLGNAYRKLGVPGRHALTPHRL